MLIPRLKSNFIFLLKTGKMWHETLLRSITEFGQYFSMF